MDREQLTDELQTHRDTLSEYLDPYSRFNKNSVLGLIEDVDQMATRLGISLVKDSGEQHAAA